MGLKQFVSTPELHSDEATESDPLLPGQVWVVEKAEDELAQGNAHGLENDEMVMLRYELAFLRGKRGATRNRPLRASNTKWISAAVLLNW
jgi:hypothetical protein